MVLFHPAAAFSLAIAANSGWHTVVDEDFAFPYAAKDAPTDRAQLGATLAKPLVVHLGMDDSA